jgi:hypothetical protein
MGAQALITIGGHGSWLAINRSSGVIAYEQRAGDESDCFLHPSFFILAALLCWVVEDTKHHTI